MQRGLKNSPVGLRIVEALDGRSQQWLSEKSGISTSTISDYVAHGIAKSEAAVAIAAALGTSVDWLLTGNSARSSALAAIGADDADWAEVPEYALLEIDELGKMDPISVTRIRRDWLYSTLGETSGLWIARLPAPYDAVSLNTGTPLICKDHRPGERMIDGTHYLFRVNGGIVMARFAFRDDGSGDRIVLSRDLGHEEDQYQVVARVVGVFAHPI